MPLAIISVALARASNIGPGYDIEMSRMIGCATAPSSRPGSPSRRTSQARPRRYLTLTQYDIDGGRHRDSQGYYASRGYVFVQAYVRGRGRSGGVKSDNLGTQVGRDGYDLVEWIAAQPWSDGRVVMFGGSFVGMTQWRTAAQFRRISPPSLRTSHLSGMGYPQHQRHSAGVDRRHPRVMCRAARSTAAYPNQAYWSGKMLEQYAAYRPFNELADAIGIAPDDWWMLDEHGQKSPMFEVWLDHVGDAHSTSPPNQSASYARMNFPVLTATGYYDDDQPARCATTATTWLTRRPPPWHSTICHRPLGPLAARRSRPR